MLLDIKSNMDRLPLNSYKTQANRKVVPRLSEYELDALQQIDLAALEAVDVQTVSPDDLVDLKDIQIDPSLPKEERIASFIRQVKNPYCYKCGKIVVKVGFEEGTTLEEQLKTIFSALRYSFFGSVCCRNLKFKLDTARRCYNVSGADQKIQHS